MVFKIREMDKENSEDVAFFDKLNYESYVTTIKDVNQYTEEELRLKYEEFEKSDPIDIKEPEHQIFLIENDEEKRAGLIWLAKREPFWRFEEKLIWIYNLHILQEFRGQGHARPLMIKAEEWSKKQGYRIIALHVIDINTAARGLYESLDYVLVATHNESCFYEKIIS